MNSTIEELMHEAGEAMADARLLWNTRKSKRATVSRAYYAAFYAAQAMLETKNLVASSHSGLISLIHQHFVKPGILPQPLARKFSNLFSKRQDSDYEMKVQISDQEVETALSDSQAFIEEVKKYLTDNHFWSQP